MSGEDNTEDGGTGPTTSAVRGLVPDVIRRSFALKFAIVLLIMGLAIGAIGAFATSQITEQTEDRIENEYSGLANQEASLVDRWIQQNRLTTQLASSDVVWSQGGESEITVAARQAVGGEFSDDVTSVHVYRDAVDEKVVIGGSDLAANETLSGTNLEWAANETFPTRRTVQMSDVYVDDGTPTVGFVSQVEGSATRFFIVEVSVEGIAGQLQGTDRAEGGFTAVVNQRGTVLIDERVSDSDLSDQARTLGTYAESGTAYDPIRTAIGLANGSSGVTARMPAQQGILDEQYTVGYAPVDIEDQDDDWIVLVHAPTQEVFGFAQSVSQWGLVATGGAVLLIVLIGGLLAYNTATSIDRLTGKAERMEEGDLDVDIRSERIDSIGRLYDGFASMRDALKEQIDEAERARKEAEVSRAEAMEMNDYLQETAEEYSEIMQACGRGDLTQRMEPEGENDAMDRIAREFDEMIGELEMTTGQLKTFATEVEESGRSVQQSAETVRDASEQVADSIQKISDDAYSQTERLENISAEMNDVAATLDAYAEDNPDVDFGDSLEAIREVADMLEEAVDLGEETMAESENVAGAAEEQAAELNEVSARAEELTRYAEYLGDGLSNFETEEEHEFVFQTGAGGPAENPGGDAEQ